MKGNDRMKKIVNKSVLFGMMIGMIMFGSIIYASNLYSAKDITYQNEKSEINNVNDALDELFKNQNNVYYLGTGTSFNIKELFPNIYDKLTEDNFIIGVTTLPTIHSSWLGNGSRFWYSTGTFNGLNLEKVYEDGILSITGNEISVQNCSADIQNNYCADAITRDTVSPYVYLIIGKIKNN